MQVMAVMFPALFYYLSFIVFDEFTRWDETLPVITRNFGGKRRRNAGCSLVAWKEEEQRPVVGRACAAPRRAPKGRVPVDRKRTRRLYLLKGTC